MSFIHEVCVFGDIILRSLQSFVVTATWHVLVHLLVFVGVGGREPRLLRLSLHGRPLEADGLLYTVRAGTRAVLLWDDPG